MTVEKEKPMTANQLGILAGIILGVAILPWQTALGKITPGQYLMIQGAVYVTVGAISQWWQPGKINFFPATWEGWQWGILAGLIYAAALMLVNKAFSIPGSSASLIGAIVAMYPAITILTECLLYRRLPSLTTFAFSTLVMVGVIGLSLWGKKI